MFKPSHPVEPRKGVVLLVVLSMLLLFSIVGVAFVVYAPSEATTNGQVKTSPALITPDMDPEEAAALALGQLIYDVSDGGPGVCSALRGHSFARNMYGNNDATLALNNDPYSGPGRLNYASLFAGSTLIPNAKNNAYLVNYTYFAADDAAGIAIRDPEHYVQSGYLGSRTVTIGGQPQTLTLSGLRKVVNTPK